MSKLTWTLLLVLSMACIATIYPITKHLNGVVDPYLLAFARFFVASIALLPIIIYRRLLILPSVKELALFGFIAVCAVAPTIIIVVGVAYTNSIVASILINTNPLIVALIAPFLIGEEVTRVKTLGLAVGFAGVLFVVLNGQNPLADVNSAYLWGSLILLFGALLSGLNKTYSRNLVRKYDGLYVTFFAVVLGSMALALVVGFRHDFAQVLQFTPTTIFSLLAIGVVSTAFPWVVWSSSLKHLDVHVAAAFNLLVPVFATLYSFAFFDESFTLWMLGGLLLTSVGIYLIQREETIPIAT